MNNIIYILKNTVNSKVYIGQTWRTLEERKKSGYVGCPKICMAIKKYGKENFYYQVLTFCSTQEVANILEAMFIKLYDSIKNGYNICFGGTNGVMVGRKHTSEARKKISAAGTGRIFSQETRNKISEKSKLYKHTNQSKEKISKAGIGRIPHNKGMRLKNETKFKISQSLMGSKQSQETIDKRIAAQIYKFDNEQKLCDRYKNGNNMSFLAKEYKCNPATIKNCLLRNNVLIRINVPNSGQFKPGQNNKKKVAI